MRFLAGAFLIAITRPAVAEPVAMGRVARLEALAAPTGVIDYVVRGPAFTLGSFGVRLVDAEMLMFPVRYYEFEKRYAWSALQLQLRHDDDEAGWYAGVRAISSTGGARHLLAPSAGLRIGRYDGTALVVEATLPVAWSRRDVDVVVQASTKLTRWGRLEARLRLRDATFDDQRHLRDVFAAVGIDFPHGQVVRTPTMFLGLGVRRVLIDERVDVAARGSQPGQERGWELMFWTSIDIAFHGSPVAW